MTLELEQMDFEEPDAIGCIEVIIDAPSGEGDWSVYIFKDEIPKLIDFLTDVKNGVIK